ncbi:MAG: L-lactate permease [Desulfarculales bacterium]|jgi:lactate permease|nr:L-lactate permease [Desulfarculales bacterium]
MSWVQIYDPFNFWPASVGAALLPLVCVFFLLACRRLPGCRAAAWALLLAFLLAVLLWGMPLDMALSAAAMGAAFGLFPVVWIIISAMWIYNMTVESGNFAVIRECLSRITRDRRIQALLIAFGFGGFLEGASGFGAPVAISAAMLVGMGFRPLYAAGICLIANTSPVGFAALGIPVIVAAGVSDLEVIKVSQMLGRQLPVLALFVPLWLCVFMCGWRNALKVWPAWLICGLSASLIQALLANFHGPALASVGSSLAALLGLIILARFWQPEKIYFFAQEESRPPEEALGYSPGRIIRAFSPFILLALLVFLWGLQELRLLLDGLAAFNIEWPALHLAVEQGPPLNASPVNLKALYVLNPLSCGGSAAFGAGILAALLMGGYGLPQALACLGRTVRQLAYPILNITVFLGLGYLLNYSGMSSTLGLALTGTGSFFPVFAPLLGWLGVFLTGSDTSSNALFCGIQKTTALAVGLDPVLTVAANSAGGDCGKMISPQSIAVATAASSMAGKEGSLLRMALPHSLAMLLFMCLLVWLQARHIPWIIP